MKLSLVLFICPTYSLEEVSMACLLTKRGVVRSIAYVNVPKEMSLKLDDKSKKFVSISCDSNCKGYKIYTHTRGKLLLVEMLILMKKLCGNGRFPQRMMSHFHCLESSTKKQ